MRVPVRKGALDSDVPAAKGDMLGVGKELLMRRTGLTMFAVAALTACSTTINLGGIRGSGDMTTETRDVSGFTRIVLEGSGSVVVEVSGTQSLTIEAEDNLISHLTSDVSNGTLTLGTDASISPTREIVYSVGVAALDGVIIEGSGNVTAGNVETDSFEAAISGSGSINIDAITVETFDGSISGSGRIEVSGSTTDLTVSIPGSGTFSGADMEATGATVKISGSGDAVVNVTVSLITDVSGSGSVEYLGNPTSVHTDISGSGSVEPR